MVMLAASEIPDDDSRRVDSSDVNSTAGLRGQASSSGGAVGLPCIDQLDLKRLTLPGQRQTLHIYDRDLLDAVEHSRASTRFLLHVAIDPEAAQQRQYRLAEVGTLLVLQGTRPSTRTSIFGGASPSLLVDVEGIGVARVRRVTQTLPFRAAEVQPITPGPAPGLLPELLSLQRLATTTARLRRVVGLADDRSEWLEGADLQFIPAADALNGTALHIKMFAAIAPLPFLTAEQRLEAVRLSGQNDAPGLLRLTLRALREETRRLLALKAIG